MRLKERLKCIATILCADDVVIISSTQNGTRFTFSTESYEQLKRLAKHAMSETVKIGARRNADR